MQRRSFFGKMFAAIGISAVIPTITLSQSPCRVRSGWILTPSRMSGSQSLNAINDYAPMKQFEYWGGRDHWRVKWTGWKTDQNSIELCGQWFATRILADGRIDKDMYVSGAPGKPHKTIRSFIGGRCIMIDSTEWERVPSFGMSAEELEGMRERAKNELLDFIDREG